VIDERIAARRQAVRASARRVRLRRTLTVAAAVTVALVLLAVERSSVVALRSIEVVGTERLDRAALLEVAALAPGTSSARLGLGDVERRLRELPLVDDVDARRTGARSVRITVRERRPVLVVRGAGVDRLMDREGRIIDAGVVEGLAVVSLRGRPPAIGEAVALDPALANAYVAWRGLSGPLRVRVQRFDAASDRDLTLWMDDGIEIRFGRAERLEEKVRALGAILEDLGGTPVAVIDVRSPTAPVVIPR
jgi:cell division protein FtsQ